MDSVNSDMVGFFRTIVAMAVAGGLWIGFMAACTALVMGIIKVYLWIFPE